MGLAEAAKACNVSVSTMRRRKDALLEAGAKVTDKGWQIPIPALVSLGLLASKTAPDATAPAVDLKPTTVPPDDGEGLQALAEVAELRQLLAAAEARAQVAEAIANERERVIEVQAQALRMLEGSSSKSFQHPTNEAVDRLPDTSADTPNETLSEAPLISRARPSKGRLRRLLGFRSS